MQLGGCIPLKYFDTDERIDISKKKVHKIRMLLLKGFQPIVSSYYVLAHWLSQRYKKKKKSGYVPFFNPLSLSDTDTIPTYKRVPKVVKFTKQTNLPKLLDLLIFCIYSLNFIL